MIGIYKITCIKTNKIYIGQSINIEYRFKQYKYLSVKNQIRIYRSIKKYGYENHLFEVIETIDDINFKILNEREQFYIDLYRKDYKLLNIREAGSSGKHSEETKIKIGNSNKKLKGRKCSEEHIAKIKKSLIGNKRRLGSKVSTETKNKMRNSHIGKKKSKFHCINISNAKKKTILQYNMNMELLNEFSCAEEAAMFNSILNVKGIRRCASGERKTAYGFIWKYKNI